MPQRAPWLAFTLAASLNLSLLAGCAMPSAPLAGPGRVHIYRQVAPSTLSGIQGTDNQQSAATLATELGISLRMERTLRSADLLSNNAASARYGVLGGEEKPEEQKVSDADRLSDKTARRTEERAREEAKQAEQQTREALKRVDEQAREALKEAEKTAEKEAKAAWKALKKADKELLKQALKEREDKLRAKLAKKLSKQKKALRPTGADVEVATADGGKEITSTYTLASAQGTRTITVTRRFDEEGTLVQSSQTIQGTVEGVALLGEQSRTIQADGSVQIVSRSEVTLEGKKRVIVWEKTIAPDGSFKATGSITRFDGETVSVASSGTEDGREVIGAEHAGVKVELAADVADEQATVAVDAGAAGQQSLSVSTGD